MPLSSDEVLALIRQVAADVISPRFRTLGQAQIAEKAPGDLVTIADHESERLLTDALLEAYPDAVVLGEEAFAQRTELMDEFLEADHAFTVDPVDGTKNFVHGSPDHAVMVAEVRDGEAVRGWIHHPAYEVSWVAERGCGVRRNGQPLTREPAGREPQGATSMWSRRGRRPEGLPPLRGSWVCCGIDYARMLEGEVDYLLYGHSRPWDHLPGTLMVAEAGGAVAHRDGTPYNARSGGGGLVAAADQDTLVRALEACRDL